MDMDLIELMSNIDDVEALIYEMPNESGYIAIIESGVEYGFTNDVIFSSTYDRITRRLEKRGFRF